MTQISEQTRHKWDEPSGTVSCATTQSSSGLKGRHCHDEYWILLTRCYANEVWDPRGLFYQIIDWSLLRPPLNIGEHRYTNHNMAQPGPYHRYTYDFRLMMLAPISNCLSRFCYPPNWRSYWPDHKLVVHRSGILFYYTPVKRSCIALNMTLFSKT